jgi:AI-2 transport protein TqsA
MRLIVALLTVSLLVVVVLALVIYGSILQFNDQLPHLTQRARELTSDFKDFVENNAPELRSLAGDLVKIETQGESRISEIAAQLLTIAANVIIEAIIVGLYVIFLLIEGHRMQCRVQKGFSNERANEILAVVQRISVGITQYMRAKVKTSLILAIPVGIILQIFNVKFALAFALLTFGCNFVPYVGSAIAFSVPTLFAFLDLPFGWKPFAVAGGLVCCHIGTASFVEPQVIGKAVGLSPLVVLISLTFWGLCWGIVGMFLAVPLTVTMVIIMENLEATRPMAQLLGDG